MATESIFTSISIETPEKAAQFVAAVERAEKLAKKHPVKYHTSLSTKETVKKYFAQGKKWSGMNG